MGLSRGMMLFGTGIIGLVLSLFGFLISVRRYGRMKKNGFGMKTLERELSVQHSVKSVKKTDDNTIDEAETELLRHGKTTEEDETELLIREDENSTVHDSESETVLLER